MVRSAIILLIFVLFTCCAHAQDYYISTTGSDSSAGTQASPWKTIQKAANTVAAGDTVHVSQGQYNERVTISRSGASGNKIVFKAEPARSAKTQGFIIKGSNVRVEGFDMTNSGDGAVISGSDVDFVSNYLHEIRRIGIISEGAGALITGNRLYTVQMGLDISGDNTLVENNEIERLYNYGTLGDCDYARFWGTNVVFRNNRFHGTSFSETGSAHVDCFQTFDDNGGYARNVLFENNFCTDFHQGLMGEAHYYHNTRDITFRNNVFAHGGSWGICSQDIAGLRIEHNTFVDIYWFGVGVSGQYGKDAVIKNNIFYGAMNDRSYTIFDGGTGVADYNLIYQAEYPASPGSHDILGSDPMFVDYNSDDFRLKPGSPACNQGEAGTYIGAFACGTQQQGCSGLGGACCISGQTCLGTTQTASDCVTCCTGTCKSQQTCIAGDLNCDKKVDIFDLVLVAQNYGKTSGFDTKADANKDGKIDIFDLVVVAQNYGKLG